MNLEELLRERIGELEALVDKLAAERFRFEAERERYTARIVELDKRLTAICDLTTGTWPKE